jgi:hypothetical protein
MMIMPGSDVRQIFLQITYTSNIGYTAVATPASSGPSVGIAFTFSPPLAATFGDSYIIVTTTTDLWVGGFASWIWSPSSPTEVLIGTFASNVTTPSSANQLTVAVTFPGVDPTTRSVSVVGTPPLTFTVASDSSNFPSSVIEATFGGDIRNLPGWTGDPNDHINATTLTDLGFTAIAWAEVAPNNGTRFDGTISGTVTLQGTVNVSIVGLTGVTPGACADHCNDVK